MSYIIFSVDNHQDLKEYQAVLRYLSQAEMDMTGNIKTCTGMYNGEIEPSFICREDDYTKFIADKWFMQEQESVLRVLDDKHKSAVLVFADGETELIGKLRDVDYTTAMDSIGWTYRHDLKKFWIVT